MEVGVEAQAEEDENRQKPTVENVSRRSWWNLPLKIKNLSFKKLHNVNRQKYLWSQKVLMFVYSSRLHHETISRQLNFTTNYYRSLSTTAGLVETETLSNYVN